MSPRDEGTAGRPTRPRGRSPGRGAVDPRDDRPAGSSPGRASRLPVAAAALAAALALAACSTPPRLPAVPDGRQAEAVIPGMPGVRYRLSELDRLRQDAVESGRREQAAFAAAGHRGKLPPADFLAISGGGEDDGFGAGLLNGWTTAGGRPEFKLVTGISTGALSAPFAFLGPRYDALLRRVYTETGPRDVLSVRGFVAALWSDAIADNAPLRALVARYVDAELLAAIRAEHERGRILLVGATDLDSRSPVLWNMGAIAASGHPRALQLFRDVLVASAAIPGAFPPMMIDVEVDGVPHQEMHVDGGVMAQVFVYPPAIELRRMPDRIRRVWVIRNARLDREWAEVERATLTILGRSVSTLIQSQGRGDLFRIHVVAQRDGVDFNLAYIPASFDRQPAEPFDSEYMRALFDVGYGLAAKGFPWAKRPPTFVDLDE